MTAAVDIVIVNYNTRADLDACLESLHAASPDALGEIVVADNASTDGSVAHVRDAWPSVRVIALDRNAGFAAANNVAIRTCRSPLVLLLNSDTIVPAGAIDRLRERLEATGAVAAGPRLVDGDGHPEVSFGPMLSPLAELVQQRRVGRAASARPADRAKTAALVSREHVVDWVSGACLLVRRQAALDAGLLDERYFMYEEDVDFCAALRARGGTVLFTPESEVVHLRGRSVRHAGAAASPHYQRSHLAFYRKHHPFWAPVLYLWLRIRGYDVSQQGRSSKFEVRS
ncbi:MAG TPA: glycosyltransferase family 2 protein [Vicinamibacterales bacterium]|jgi:GT2 family glycosyltransferase|nr:glycosyltransferase family 2 protein [Vicinamibacterales bacterium]